MNQLKNKIFCGGNLEVVSSWPSNFISAICTDPPYGLEFMGKEWDKLNLNVPFSEKEKGGPGGFKHHIRFGHDSNAMQQWHYQWAKAILRITKPGGFLLCFGGTRTYHRLACAIEDAGWEIRDCMMWLYGSGFPKSHNISKAIDKAAGAKRGRIKFAQSNSWREKENRQDRQKTISDNNAIMPLAQLWQGYGTALKPAWEPILVCMKPLDGTFAHNAEKHGVAGLNIDGGRIGTEQITAHGGGKQGNRIFGMGEGFPAIKAGSNPHQGRWPANLLLSCDCQNNHLTGNAFYGIIQVAIKETEICQSRDLHSSANSVEERKVQSGMTNEAKNLFSVIESVRIDSLEKILGKLLEDIDTANAGCLEEMLMGSINTSLNMFISGKEQMEKYQTVMKSIISTVLEQIINSRISNVLQFQGIEVFITKIINGIQREGQVVLHNKDCPVKILDEQKEGASRFFYQAKTSRKERNMGMDDCEGKKVNDGRQTPIDNPYQRGETVRLNTHPTVKPLALMRYLCTLLKMPGSDQIILDPFLGSGTTGIACKELGIDFIGIEKEQEYCEIAVKRIAAAKGQEITLHSGSPEKSLPVSKNVETVRTPHVSESRQRIIAEAVRKLKSS